MFFYNESLQFAGTFKFGARVIYAPVLRRRYLPHSPVAWCATARPQRVAAVFHAWGDIQSLWTLSGTVTNPYISHWCTGLLRKQYSFPSLLNQIKIFLLQRSLSDQLRTKILCQVLYFLNHNQNTIPGNRYLLGEHVSLSSKYTHFVTNLK